MTHTAEDLAASITQLTSFSDVVLRLDSMLADENSSAAQIGNLIEQDPALTAKLIRIANSALFNAGVPIDSVKDAVTRVGMRQVRDITLGVCATEAFDGIPNDLVSPEDFWKHSLSCAISAQLLASHTRQVGNESAFTAGLLHDIGQLVMFSKCPEQSQQALLLSIDLSDGRSTYLAEREIFGFDHANVGAELAKQWGFPDNLRHCVEWHHEPFECDEISNLTVLIHIANSVAVLAELDSVDMDDAAPVDPRAFDQLQLDTEIIPEIVAETRESVADLLRLFLN